MISLHGLLGLKTEICSFYHTSEIIRIITSLQSEDENNDYNDTDNKDNHKGVIYDIFL